MKLVYQKKRSAFALTDVIVCTLALVGICGMVFPYLARSKCTSTVQISCINNLRQVGVGFRLYAYDGTPYPQFSPTNEAWNYFQTAGKEIGSPKVLICRADPVRSPAIDFEVANQPNNFSYVSNRNNALSYFFGGDVDLSNPNGIISGDRNISRTKEMKNGILVWKTNDLVSWTKDLHDSRGNVVLSDGSAAQLNNRRLRKQLSLNTNSFVRFVLP